MALYFKTTHLKNVSIQHDSLDIFVLCLQLVLIKSVQLPKTRLAY